MKRMPGPQCVVFESDSVLDGIGMGDSDKLYSHRETSDVPRKYLVLAEKACSPFPCFGTTSLLCSWTSRTRVLESRLLVWTHLAGASWFRNHCTKLWPEHPVLDLLTQHLERWHTVSIKPTATILLQALRDQGPPTIPHITQWPPQQMPPIDIFEITPQLQSAMWPGRRRFGSTYSHSYSWLSRKLKRLLAVETS